MHRKGDVSWKLVLLQIALISVCNAEEPTAATATTCTPLYNIQSLPGIASRFYLTSGRIVQLDETYRLFLSATFDGETTCTCRAVEIDGNVDVELSVLINRFWIDIPCVYDDRQMSVVCKGIPKETRLHQNTSRWAFYPQIQSTGSINQTCIVGSLPMVTHAALIDEEYEQTGRVKVRKLDGMIFTPSKPIVIQEEMPAVFWGLFILVLSMVATVCAVLAVKKKKWIAQAWHRTKARVALKLGQFKMYRRLDDSRVQEYELQTRSRQPIPYITDEESSRLRELVGEEYLRSEHSALNAEKVL